MGCGASSAAAPEEARVAQLERGLEEKAQHAAERAERLEREVAALRAGKAAPHEQAPDSGPQHAGTERHAQDSSTAPSQALIAKPPPEAPHESPAQQQQLAAGGTEKESTPFWTNERKKVFKGVVQGGVRAVWALCKEYQGVLPFPGGPGVALIGQIAELLGQAMANKDNLESLFQRATELMDIIIEKHVNQEELSASLARKGSNEPKPGSRKYCSLMEQLRDLLEEILEYTRGYCDRNFLLKLLMTSYDRDQFSDLADRLARLMVDAQFSVTVDTHSMTVEVHAMNTEMREMLTSVRDAMPYMDHSSEVQRMVESLGGIDNVLSSQDKVEQVAKHLDHAQQITIAMMTSQVHASLLAAMAKNDTGVHTVLRNTDMRTFWKQFFSGLPKVEWDVWWCAFPNRLHDVLQDKEVVDKVIARLSTEQDMAKFQSFIERSDAGTLSIREVELAFPMDASILDVVEQAVSPVQTVQSDTGNTEDSQSGALPQQPRQSLPSSTKQGHCLLPQLGANYTGRGKDAADLVEIVKQLSSSSRCTAVCVVAGAGFGKSTVAMEVGWKLVQAGICPGGAVMVDLRESGSFEASLGRICGALNVTMDDHAAENISTHLTACHHKYSGPKLLLLDNAEDSAGGPDGAQFGGFVAQMARDAVLLITSRAPITPDQGVHQYTLSCLSAAASRSLLRFIAPSLGQQEVEEAADLCGGVPLLLRRAGDALQTGQIAMEDLKAATAAAADQTTSILNLTLCTLPHKQQLQLAQLSVFPSGFKGADAAAVLRCDEACALGLLKVQCRHGLVTRDYSAGTFSLHMAVRSAAAGIGGADVQRKGQERFVVHVIEKLGQWTDLFFSAAWELPLALAREAGADILAAFKLAGQLTEQSDSLPESVVSALLSLDAFPVEELLQRAGHRRGTWSQLEHLHSACVVQAEHSQEHAPHEHGRHSEQHAAAALLHTLATKSKDAAYAAACEAKELYAQSHGEDHPRTIACTHAQGKSLQGLHKYTEAEALYRQAYEAQLSPHRAAERAGKGPQPPGELLPLWLPLFSLACCLHFSQRLPHKAEPLYKDLHTQLSASLGPLHPFTSDASNGLASCLRGLGKLSAAEEMFRATLEARKQVLGDSHPDVLSSMQNVANCLRDQGKLSEAEALYKETIEARKRVLGEANPSVFVSMNELAICLKRQGKSGDAEALYRATYEARKCVLGKDHPDTLTSLNNLAYTLGGQGKHSDAEALYIETMEARMRVLGEDHPDVLQSINNLANCLKDQGKLAEAEPLYMRSLQGRQRVLGEDHPSTLSSMNNLANFLKSQGNLSGAEEQYRRTLDARKRVMGDNHPDTLQCMNNLAGCLRSQGKLSEAEALYKETIEARKRVLGEAHPSTLASKNELEKCLKQQGKPA